MPPRTFPRLAGLAALLVAGLALAAAPAAHASRNQESIIEDEHEMLNSGPVARAHALDDAVALGADTIRVLVVWRGFAPAPNSTHRPSFDATNSFAYPQNMFAELDDLIGQARVRGLQVLLTPTGFIPSWASHCKSSRSTCRPDANQFGQFVEALGRRYPTVHRWSLWNEPNQPGWLSPQYVAHGRARVPAAADIYRGLARAGVAALHASGHGGDQILLGETAPIGRKAGHLARIPVPPEPFIRELLCIDARGHKLRGATARSRGCSGFKKLAVTGYAHHPYTRGGSQPPLSATNAGEITIANAGRLKRVLDQGARAGRVPRHLAIYYTENGWQTNPPDHIFGVSLARQAEYINQADWISYRDQRVRSVAQYQIFDDPSLAQFQSGLRFANGKKKPAYGAYRLPIWVVRRGGKVTVYGQARPAADRAAGTVAIQRARNAHSAFATVRTVADGTLKGQFSVTFAVKRGVWRLAWSGLTSRVAQEASR
jgi:hypothetical protein